MTAYADALAACVAAFGEPRDVYAVGARARVWWAMSWDGESEEEDGVLLAETGDDTIDLHAMRGPAAEERWTLAGDGATPLPDAIAAAGAWLRGER